MITHLISTTKLVKTLQNINPNDNYWNCLYRDKTGGLIEWTMWLWRLVENYVNFISQKPTLNMFISCDEEGNILEEPIKKNFRYNGTYIDNMYYQLLEEYQQAQSKVLFKDWRILNNDEYEVEIANDKFNLKYSKNMKSFVYEYNCSTTQYEHKTLEEFVDYNLELKEITLKQIIL